MQTNWFIAVPISSGMWFEKHLNPQIEGLWQVHPADLHMTVAFLGDVDEAQARRAFSIHSRWAGGPMEVTGGPLIALGDPHRYHALVLTFSEGNDVAKAMMTSLGPPMRECVGRPAETRPPLPHITVVRAKRRAGKQERAKGLLWSRQVRLPRLQFTLDELALFRGRGAPNGPRYEAVERVQLLR